MNNTIKQITLPFILALGVSSTAALADAVDRLHAFVKDSKTLSGRFTQVVYDAKGKKSQESSGVLYFSRPGKFRWVYSKPYEQLIVGDGKKIWIYDADLEQVTVKKLGEAIGQSPAALLAGNNDIDRNFNLRDAGRRDNQEWLEATPKNKEGTFETVRLGFAENELQTMELRDNFGQTTLLHFDGLDSKARLKPDLFRFKPPRGVDVIGDE